MSNFTYYEPVLLAALAAEPDAVVGDVGDSVAADAASMAPREIALLGHPSRGGAESIHSEVSIEDGRPVAKISWDAEHYYMKFVEYGTSTQPAQHFMRRAAQHYKSAQKQLVNQKDPGPGP